MKIAIATKPTVESLWLSNRTCKYGMQRSEAHFFMGTSFWHLGKINPSTFIIFSEIEKYQNVKIKPIRLQIKIMM